MDLAKVKIEIRKHAVEKAWQLGIDSAVIEDVIAYGKMQTFGKHGVKFTTRDFIAVGYKVNDIIRIVTIERKCT